MAGENKFEIEKQGLNEVRREINDRYNLYRKGLKLVMWRALTVLEAGIISNIRRNFTQRTGTLMNSVGPTKNVYEQGDNIVGEIGNNAVYSAIHEFGGVIKPKQAKFLWIPSDYNANRDGTVKITPSDVFSSLSRQILFRKNTVFLLETMKAGRKGEHVKMTPLFFLRSSVNMPARPFIYPALEKNRDRILEKFGLFLQEAWNVKSSGGSSGGGE